MEFLIVSGMSGAGKSRTIDALEDIGFYCVDNLPPMLLAQFAELCQQSKEAPERVAIAIDARSGNMLKDFEKGLQQLSDCHVAHRILFLDCDTPVLARRYKETRRRHPLMDEGLTSVTKAVETERQMLSGVRERTDYLIDTSHLSAAQLREQILKLFLENPGQGMTIQCLSFGFKYGYPAEADLVLDVRCFPNPFYVETLRQKTGLDADVREYVLESEDAQAFLAKLYDLVDFLIPRYENEGKTQLVIAIGCTGGKHRSVTFAECLTRHLQEKDLRVMVNHRDIQKL